MNILIHFFICGMTPLLYVVSKYYVEEIPVLWDYAETLTQRF